MNEEQLFAAANSEEKLYTEKEMRVAIIGERKRCCEVVASFRHVISMDPGTY